jgi:formylglycine-generating enzyme required for sulfatase activity
LKKQAVLIGANHRPAEPADSVQIPGDRLDRLAQLLAARHVGAFDRVDLVRNPNRQALIDTLESACVALQRHDLILVYVAGFCVTDDRGSLCLATADADNPAVLTDTLPLASLALMMNLSASQQQVLLLDCAHENTRPVGVQGSQTLPTADLGAPFRSVVTARAPFLPLPAINPIRMDKGDAGEPAGKVSFPLADSLIDLLEKGDPSGSRRYLSLSRLCELLGRGNVEAAPGQTMPSLSVYHADPSLQDQPVAHNRAYVSLSRACARQLSRGETSNKNTARADHGQACGRQPRTEWFKYAVGLGVVLFTFLALLAVSGWSLRPVQVMVWNNSQGILNFVTAVVQTDPASRPFHDLLLTGGHGPVMIALPPGNLLMGSSDSEAERFPSEAPQRKIQLERFAVSIGEISFDDYGRFVSATGRRLPEDEGWGRGERPVIHVSWHDAVNYTRWLSAQTGQRYRLPSEVEWEYLARAGSTTPFSTGSCIHTDLANYNGKFDYARCGARTGVQRGQTLPTSALPANPWGLYHVHGNVWEWVEDCWHTNYQQAVASAAAWTQGQGGQCERRVIRGGSWRFKPGYLRSAARLWSETDESSQDIGFRVVRDL